MAPPSVMRHFKLQGRVPRPATVSAAPRTPTGAWSSPVSVTSLPFAVFRTPSHQLPVYRKTRAGGTHLSTRIQRVEGSADALRQELIDSAGIPAERILVNPVTRHVECKGDYVTLVKQHLQRLGF